MSRFREEMRVIPVAAWVIAFCGFVGVALFLLLVSTREMPLSVRLPSMAIPLVFSVWLLLVGYVNGDARRRGMRHVLWTLMAILIPSSIGIILYFILREPILSACPKCGTLVSSACAFCPACGAALRGLCPECRRPVESGWSHCGQCGAALRTAPAGISGGSPGSSRA
jgi:hypothetical protein